MKIAGEDIKTKKILIEAAISAMGFTLGLLIVGGILALIGLKRPTLSGN
jgi:hypothetical protein